MKRQGKIFVFLLSMMLLAGCGVKTTDKDSTSDSQKTASSGAKETSASVSQTASSNEIVEEYIIHFDLNYEGSASVDPAKVKKGETLSVPNPPTREGYVFLGWFTDAATTKAYDFNAPVTGDLTLYAGWESANSGNVITVTYYYNYEGAPSDVYTTVSTKKNLRTTAPEAPTRDGYYFVGWYTDAACTTAFDFKSLLTESISLYAFWQKEYRFEAEYVDLEDMQGMGYSVNVSGTQMIIADTNNIAHASNGYSVGFLYYNGAEIDFEITSSAAVNNVSMVLRLTAQYFDMNFDSSNYDILVNDTEITGYHINLSGAVDISNEKNGNMRPFSDHLISTNVSLKEGKNIIALVVDNNNNHHTGTMQADAPTIDCMTLNTNDATLSWSPHTENIA